jgi:DNA-binding transcriptional MocR family regulator
VAQSNRANHADNLVQAPDISSRLGDWTARTGPLYYKLAEALNDAATHGLLPAGARLPSERLLAEQLAVSRGTVVAAYEALCARGAAQTRRNSGTYLVRSAARGPAVHGAPLFSRLVDGHHVPIDFSIGAIQRPDALPNLSIDFASAARLMPAHGYAPLGAPDLRAAIAEHLTRRRGVHTQPDQVVVTAGGQGALSLIAAAFVRPGDRVLVEAPTYPGAIEVFSRAGAQVEGIDRDGAGPIPDSLKRLLASRPARLVYLVPTCHNPTGSVMSEVRRRDILGIAASARVPVIDDTVLADLLFEGGPPPDLAALDSDNVLSVGSLSKCFWGGVRIGWIRAPAETVLRLGRIRAALDFGNSAVSQAIALSILEAFDDVTARARARAAEHVAVLADELAAKIPDWKFAMPRGGLSLWVALPHGSGDQFAQLALRHGVAVSPGESAAPGERFAAHLRLSAGPAPQIIREGVDLLAQAWSDMSLRPLATVSSPTLAI